MQRDHTDTTEGHHQKNREMDEDGPTDSTTPTQVYTLDGLQHDKESR